MRSPTRFSGGSTFPCCGAPSKRNCSRGFPRRGGSRSSSVKRGNEILALEAIRPSLDVERLREDFPILRRKVGGKSLVYLDNAATTQKPRAVIETIRRYYATSNANVHRGVHTLSDRATRGYEEARVRVARFLNAREDREITVMEHPSNIVPWQMVCAATGAALKVVPVHGDGELDIVAYGERLSHRTRLVAVTHVSNALGTVNPIREMIGMAHGRNIPVLVDGAQAAPHVKVDVRELGRDFYAFSGHKVYGPTGIGVLYGKREHLEAMQPYQGGGDMILRGTIKRTTYNEIPYKFEAGTRNIAGAIGLCAALGYLDDIGREAVAAHERELLDYATETVGEIPGVRLVGTAREKAGILSFVMEGVHPHDLGTVLDHEGVAIRTGNHCAMPLMDALGLPATARASFGMYNTRAEVDALVEGIWKAREVLL